MWGACALNAQRQPRTYYKKKAIQFILTSEAPPAPACVHLVYYGNLWKFFFDIAVLRYSGDIMKSLTLSNFCRQSFKTQTGLPRGWPWNFILWSSLPSTLLFCIFTCASESLKNIKVKIPKHVHNSKAKSNISKWVFHIALLQFIITKSTIL